MVPKRTHRTFSDEFPPGPVNLGQHWARLVDHRNWRDEVGCRLTQAVQKAAATEEPFA